MSPRARAVLRVFGIVIASTSLSKLPPAVLALALGEDTASVFLSSFAATMLAGMLLCCRCAAPTTSCVCAMVFWS